MRPLVRPHVRRRGSSTHRRIQGRLRGRAQRGSRRRQLFKNPEFKKYDELLEATDKARRGQLTKEDVEKPKGWILLGYTIDPRTGLGPIPEVLPLARET